MAKPSLPPGTRDFSAEVVRKRNFLFNTIRSVFECYGFGPLETPAMEQLDTLLGKYGEEGDKLIFKILNNGLDHPDKEQKTRDALEQVLKGKNSKDLTERALRYDLTIPFARYVATWHQQLTLPFKRYQMQPVWRADRPQRGRYREFYQCDVDVVGSRSLLNELELGCICHHIFTRLGLPDYSLRINHRQLLVALAARCGDASQLVTITTAIDKLDKVGIEKVKEELANKNLSAAQIDLIEAYLNIGGSLPQQVEQLRALLGQRPEAIAALEELQQLIEDLQQQQVHVLLDPTLARGLNYYTGTIFEIKAPARVNMGSLGGGGRYDDLTGLFGVPGLPGVGLSFGVDRIYDVLEELQLFPHDSTMGTQVLFFNLGADESRAAFVQLQGLRERGLAAELYPESVKFDKQFKYAEKRNFTYIAIIGKEEMAKQQVNVKNIRSGEQRTCSWKELATLSFTW
ncbi:MAG: histidine--tRNA ligase [Sphingomonadales bacterium]|nr:histidine--tRNA ligase [Sphingomonadales bacterium]